jgi:hypothetical protein
MPYTYQRGSSGVDETFDIQAPDGTYLVAIHFWDEAEHAEERARLIVDALNFKDVVTRLAVALLWTMGPPFALFGLLSLTGR